MPLSRIFHILSRKTKTLWLTVQKCSNWPAVILAKMRIISGPRVLRLRDGLRLEVIPPLASTWGEIFEPAIADLYGIQGGSYDFIVDVGANIGAFTCYAALRHPEATVHAFEPSPRHAELLRKNIEMNELKNVIVHQHAVTKDGREVTYSHLGSGGSSGIFLRADRGTTVLLESVSLDRVKFATTGSTFIKLDCEGAEGEIIEWLCENRNSLPARVMLACEYHPWCPVPVDESLNRLRSSGFSANATSLFDESYIFATRD